MSGPKGANYRVISAAEQERRRNEELCAQCRALLAKVVEEYESAQNTDGEAIARQLEPSKKTAQTLAKWQQELEYMHQTAKAAAAAKQQERRQKLLEKAFADNARHVVRLGVTESKRPKAASSTKPANKNAVRQSTDAEALKQIHASIEKALSLAADIEADSVCAQLGAESARIYQIEDASIARASLSVFESQVEKALRQQRQQRHLAEQKSEIALSLSHLNNDTAKEIISGLGTASDATAVAALAVRASGLLETDSREQDAAYVAKQIAEVLSEMDGYSAYGEAATDDSNTIVVQRADLTDCVLRIRIDSERSAVFTNVEYTATSGRIKAKDREAAICPDITELQERMTKNGIETEWIFRQEPGAVPMKELVAAKTADKAQTRATKRKKKGKLEQLELGRGLKNG
ncbi:MAG: hypothetical protein LBL86_10040 [Coriobacteriales bacterium]|nr:hypothetical protein [Coriobacteriales bacterium]